MCYSIVKRYQKIRMEINYNKIRIGDRLIRNKGGIFSKHHALYAGFWKNQHLIAENQLGFGVRYITLREFLSEGSIDRIQYHNFTENSQPKSLIE